MNILKYKDLLEKKYLEYRVLYKSNAYKKFKTNYPNIYWIIMNNIYGKSFTEKLYRLVVDDYRCPITNEYTKFREWSKGFVAYSNNADIKLVNEHRRNIRSQIMLKVHSNGKIDLNGMVDKVKKTKLERYGDENYNNQNKNKKTKLERYGDENYNNRNKYIITMNDRYGGNTLQSSELYNKYKKTMIEKYGVNSPLKSKKIHDKVKNTNLDKYGVENPTQNVDIARKISESSLLKKSHGVFNRVSLMFDLLFNITDYIGVRDDGSGVYYPLRCKQCGNEFEALLDSGKIPICTKCNPKNRSNVEIEVIDYINSIYTGNLIHGTRSLISHKEIDIYLPDLNLAIEVDGIYWHTESQGKGRKYHYYKTRDCLNKGVKLIHIFDNEWKYRQDIVKSILKNMIVGSSDKIQARKCIIRDVSFNDSVKFLNDNHIQGSDKSKFRYGLYYNDELVSIMTFGKSRYGHDTEYEMYRYCNKLDTNIVGGAKRLFKYFVKSINPKSIKTFSDIRYFDGKVYERLGFEFIEKTRENYFYTKDFITLESRNRYQKHLLSEKLDKFDNDLSEYDNMLMNGYHRIWDCGNNKFIWNGGN